MDKNKFFDIIIIEVVEEDRVSFIFVGINILFFKLCVKKDFFYKVVLDVVII